MKKQLIFIILLLFVSISMAGAFIDFFYAKSDGSNVRIEWKTNEEKNVKVFVVERRSINSDFVQVSTVLPKGNNSFYSFTDENAYKSENLVLVYRIKIVDNDNSTSFSKEISVTHSVSNVKRTWGSIKSMFR